MEAFLQLLISLTMVLGQSQDLPEVNIYDRTHGSLQSPALTSVVETFSEAVANQTNPQDQPDHFYAAALERSGIKLAAESIGYLPSDELAAEFTRCKATAFKTLVAMPGDHAEALQNLTFTFNPKDRRGYGGSKSIILRCVETQDPELAAVLVHELGHIVDLGKMNSSGRAEESEFYDGGQPIYEDDVSLEFYRISWASSTSMRADASELDFVSEYAATDVFEDFAESYAFYVLQGGEFRELAETNVALARKYQFIRDNVFAGVEFDLGFVDLEIFQRPYDVTVLPYDYRQLISSSVAFKKTLAQRLDK